MNVSTNPGDGGGDKRLPEASIQTIPQNLTTIQTVQSAQNMIQSNIQTIQSTQGVVGAVGQPGTLVGKSVSLELNPKLSLSKPGMPSNIVSSTDSSKLTATLCQMSPTLRIISPNMISNVERQPQPQSQEVQQVVTSIPATYHVPRGPAAVASISTPRATIATPIVRSTGQAVPISRPGVSATVPSSQWPPKTPYLYVPPQRHPLPIVQRVTTRPAVYSSVQQPRLVTSVPGRPVQAVQAAVVTGLPGAPCRLRAPILQTNNNVARLPVAPTRPTAQLEQVPQISQSPRAVSSQPIQLTQPTRTLTTSSTVNRIAVAAPVMGTASRITSVASVQPTVNKQVAITTSAPTSGSATVSRIVLPQQQTIPRVVQTVASVTSLAQVSRVITTVANTASVPRVVSQPGQTSVARITGISMHSLPITPTRATPTTIKTTPTLNVAQAIQPKQPIQQSTLRIVTSGATSSSNTMAVANPPQPVQATYSQYRPAAIQPVRLLVEPAYEEPQYKPNASPRPSILRKRDHDSSPAKGVVKNLTPVLANMPLSSCSPPSSPRADRDGGGCQSSGSTTVSATSSPGLDEEPEQSRININLNININTTVEMSPRKKPRKQQLTGVELTESRCTEVEMQFITEEKIRKEKEEKERATHEKKQSSLLRQESEQTPVRTRPTPSLLGSSWKNRWNGRLHHYRRPSDVRPKEERRPTVAELAQGKNVIQKLNGWKIYHLTAQMENLAEMEKQVHDKLKSTLAILEAEQSVKDDGLERTNELIKGNMQRSSLISEGMNEARSQLVTIFQHQGHVRGILERNANKRSQKKRDK
ncbi:histone deacetylase complex subunit SAP130-A [Belonocnema kinseyi]|uniref:histone deacetylase complex subunit SAP130-A n=1 Tax=Belonocnema kinseyi TaxID=2817044 RepID=UPI00143CDD15|nr:histone deacetylase complex subunit SAP130-A [Belonocnema kinseyi]XP_033216144.1 histone deacetylase complex subunit SAP130-A [Belonocnema kinseyi]